MEQGLNWNDCLAHVEATDVGMRRSNNQDSHAVLLASDNDNWQRRGHVFVVADGMGAHAAGELASKMAADGIPHNYYKLRDDSAPDAIRKAIRQVNEEIHRKGQANAEFHGMGTTASVLVLVPQGALIAHVGDSRIYRLRGTRIEQLTFDHSLVWEMTASGQFNPNLPNLVPKNIITRSLGPHKNVQVDLEGPFPLEIGDTFLVCCDGLSGLVKDEEMGVIMGALPPAEAAQVLIDLANLRGGPDNITVVIVRITGPAIAARANSQAAPLALADERAAQAPPPPASGKIWLGAALSLAAAVGLAAFGFYIPAVGALILAAALVTWGFLQRLTPERPTHYLAPGARLGRAPYRSLDCPANESLVNNLGLLIDQLREAASDGQWSVEWAKFNAYSSQGKSAIERRDYAQAIREYSRALRFMMNELRSQGRRRPPGDANVDVLSRD
jgi:protein phosphatase